MDAYRLDSAPEAAELDLDEMLAQGSLLIEWPERIREVLPAEPSVDFVRIRSRRKPPDGDQSHGCSLRRFAD